MILSNETINRFPVLRYKDIESDSKLQHDKPKWNPWLQLIHLFIDLNSFAKIPGAWNFYYSDCVMNHSIFPPANDRLSRIPNRPGNTTSDLHRTFIKIKDNNTNFLFFDFTGSPFATEILIFAKSLFSVNFAYFTRNFIRSNSSNLVEQCSIEARTNDCADDSYWGVNFIHSIHCR